MIRAPKIAVVALLSLLLLGGVSSLAHSEYDPEGVPDELIETLAAQQPDSHASRIVSGFMQFDMERFAKAERHFAKAASLTPNDPYDRIWLYMAQLRQNADTPDANIRSFVQQHNSSEFVYTDIAILLGDVSPEQGIAKARASKDPGNICEAYYYAAQRLLVDGHRQKAKEYFAEAVQTEQESFWEYMSAAVYLKQHQ